MLRKLSALFFTLCLLTAALTSWAAAASGLRLVSSSTQAASQEVGFSGLPSNCQSFQATFTLSSSDTVYNFTAHEELDTLPGIYTTYKQEGGKLTVYVTTKSGVLTDNGTLTLGTISASDSTQFTVEEATGVKVVDSSHVETTYDTVDQDGPSGGSDNGDGSDNGSAPDNGGGSNNGGGSDSGNNGSGTTSRTITIQSSLGGKVISSASQAVPGKVITLTATPNSGYVLQSLRVSDASGKSVSLTRQGSGKPQLPFTDVPTRHSVL